MTSIFFFGTLRYFILPSRIFLWNSGANKLRKWLSAGNVERPAEVDVSSSNQLQPDVDMGQMD